MNARTTERNSRRSGESGSGILLVLAIILLVVYLGALVVDITMMQRTADAVQYAADAASLSGATQLVLTTDSRIDRWKNSKRAALGMLRAHFSRMGTAFPDLTSTAVHKGNADACENLGDYRSQTYDDGNVRIELERGIYVDSEPPVFTSLEDSTTCKASVAGSPRPNAVHLRVTAGNESAFFGFIAKFGPVVQRFTREATGTRID